MPELNLWTLPAVFAGGGLGSVLRFLISKFSAAYIGSYPYGTLAANLLGALLAGLAAVMIFQRKTFSGNTADFILAGFLGGLTTFSSMVLDAHRLVSGGELFTALVYLMLNLLLGFGLFHLAFSLARAA